MRQLLSGKRETWFAWYPVPLHRSGERYWERTGEWAWLTTVEVTHTFPPANDVFYSRIAP